MLLSKIDLPTLHKKQKTRVSTEDSINNGSVNTPTQKKCSTLSLILSILNPY